jgi:hypothetical protein
MAVAAFMVGGRYFDELVNRLKALDERLTEIRDDVQRITNGRL